MFVYHTQHSHTVSVFDLLTFKCFSFNVCCLFWYYDAILQRLEEIYTLKWIIYSPQFLDSGSVSDRIGLVSYLRMQTKNTTTQTQFSPLFAYCIHGKRSYGRRKSRESRIWYRVWHCPNCCRMRSILRNEIYHRLRVKSLCTYDSLLLTLYQYSSSAAFFPLTYGKGATYFFRVTTSCPGIHTTTVVQDTNLLPRRMVGTMRENIHATVRSTTWNPHYY